MGQRDPFSQYLAKMQAAGFRPSSSLGQNFLLDPSLHRWLAAEAAPTRCDTVVEIGTGLGFLTRELAALAGRVVGVEIDDRLLMIARDELKDVANIDWLHGDALGGPARTLLPQIGEAASAALAAGGEFLLVANLPYAVSGPLLAEVAALPTLPARAVLLVQKELAVRIAAPPGGSEYGSLTAVVQTLFTAKVLRLVPPQVFRPRPKVMSAVLMLERRVDSLPQLAGAESRREFGVFVRTLFQQRRKVLRTTLAMACAAIGRQPPPRTAAELQLRAEQLDPETLARWWIETL